MPPGDRVAAILLLLFGLFVVAESRGLAYWTARAPGPGFLPFWLGVLLAAAAGAIALRSPAVPPGGERAPAEAGTGRVLVLLGLTAGAVALGKVVGFVPSSGVFIGVTLTYLRPGRARANWTVAAAAVLVIHLVFVRWLAVPLPIGPFGL